MPSILLVNPNTTASMTDKIAAAAAAVAGSHTRIAARNPATGPAAIEGREDGAAALPGLLEVIERAEGFDAIVIACFDDTGLAEARRRARVPVLGIGEAAFHVASLVAPSFSVVTTLAVSVPIIADNIAGYGFGRQCRAVRASNVPVLALEGPGMEARDKVSAEIAAALREDGCAAIILGCAGMTDLAADLSRQHGVPVIDGVAAAVKLAEASIGFSRPA